MKKIIINYREDLGIKNLSTPDRFIKAICYD
jgi:hypothetical protein